MLDPAVSLRVLCGWSFIGRADRRRGSSSVDRRARESPPGSGRRGSLRAAAPPAQSDAPTVTRCSRRHESESLLDAGRAAACVGAARGAGRPPASPPRVRKSPRRPPHQIADVVTVRGWRSEVSGSAASRASDLEPPASTRSLFSGAACGGCCIAVAGAGAEHQPLEQRVAGQPVRAVHAGAGDLAGREESRQRGAAPLVGVDAAHDVVRRGPDRNRIAREIEADAPAHLGDRRKPPRARNRRRDAPASGRRDRRSARSSRTMLRATTSRGARSPPG